MNEVTMIADRAARRYARRCWWADVDELRQEASIAVLLSQRTWDSGVGVPFHAYAYRAAILHLTRYLWRNSSPVSERDNKRRDLRGVYHLELTDDVLPGVDTAGASWTDELLDDYRWHARVREQLNYLLDAEAPVAMRALLDEQKPKEVALEFGLPVNRVYRIVERARTLMSENALLHELWKENNAQE